MRFASIILLVFLVSPSSFGETTTSGGGQAPVPAGVSINPSSYGMARACNNFVSNDGLGNWGGHLQSAIGRVGASCFLNGGIDFTNLCPRYNSFNNARKMQYIAFLFASIAHYESSCRQSAQAQGVNDTADGLLQLEYSQRQRRAAGRNPVHCATNRGVNTQGIGFQMECGASIFKDGYCGTGRVPGRSSWYWQKLNGNRSITRMARRFPFCN